MLKTAITIALSATLLSPTLTQAASGGGAAEAGHGGDHSVDPRYAPSYPKGPAKRYSGSTPIDLDHGVTGTNGTYGNPNPTYEEKGKTALAAPGLLTTPYEHADKGHFVAAIENRLEFFRTAIIELGETSQNTKPEAVSWAKEALPRLQSLLDQTTKALKQAKSAGAKDWPAAEQEARAAVTALMGTYYTLTSTAAHGLTATPSAQ